jgi:uncharacterized protein GlcG (DUF336 family)
LPRSGNRPGVYAGFGESADHLSSAWSFVSRVHAAPDWQSHARPAARQISLGLTLTNRFSLVAHLAQQHYDHIQYHTWKIISHSFLGEIQMPDITMKQAQAVVAAALKKAEEIGAKMNIAVVDAGANLKAFVRMDEAWLGSMDVSIKKAKTARFFDMPTGEIGKLSQPGGSLYNIEHSNGGLISFPGGVPLKNKQGEIIGAVGVSGSIVENDHAVASAGASAIL